MIVIVSINLILYLHTTNKSLLLCNNMKRFFFFLFFLVITTCASAQIQYYPTYNNQQQRNNTPQSRTESYRTTAYRVDYQNNVYKMPIVVEISSNGYGSVTMRVTQRYVDTGLGGRWEKIYSGGNVQKCQSLIGSNSLESQFMYKANINANIWYFDL